MVALMVVRVRDSIPLPVALAGAFLVGSVALPLAPSGESFLDIARRAFAVDPLHGVMTVLGLGSPYLFGVATVLLGTLGDAHGWLRSGIRLSVSLMAGQLLLVSALLVRHDLGLYAAGLLGFAIVGTAYLLYFSARSRAEGTGEVPSMRFIVRWGALLIFGVGSWLRLQWVDNVRFGPAVDAAWIAAVVILWSMRPGAMVGMTVAPDSSRAPHES